MVHVVSRPAFTSETARDAVNQRLPREQSGRSPSAIQARIREYFEKTGDDPDTSDPNIALANIMSDPSVPCDVRVVAAKTLQPYYHGSPLAPEQVQRTECDIEANDPDMAVKRKQAYDCVLGLIKERADTGYKSSTVPLPNRVKPESIAEGKILDMMNEQDGTIPARDVTND